MLPAKTVHGFISFAIFSLIFLKALGPNIFSEAADKSSNTIGAIELHECKDAKLKIQFLCYPDWELQTEKDTVLIIVSKDPLVTITIAKSDDAPISLRQLTPRALKEMGQYADGFETQNVVINGQGGVEVKGRSLTHPKARFLDYYIVRHGELYSLLFSVEPHERWRDYEPLLIKIKDSVRFL